MRQFILILVAITALLQACEKTIELDLEQTPSKIVIDALLTDREGYQFVKITRSVDFYGTGKSPRVTDAIVTIEDDQGEVHYFVHNPGMHKDSVGIYIPEIPFTGTVGYSYKLRVEINGEIYEAEDQMYPVTKIDSIGYRIDEDERGDPEIEGKYYETLFYAKEPPDTKDYYFFKMFRNDSLTYQNETDVYYSDDRFLAENIDGVPLPVYYGVGDKAVMEMYSISRNGFIFFNDLFSLLNNDGGIVGPPPANPRTNLSNGALGFFQVSALEISEPVVIQE